MRGFPFMPSAVRRPAGYTDSPDMRIPEHLLNSIAFLCMDDEVEPGRREHIPKASAFFVLIAEEEKKFSYLVTARHCVRETRGETFFIRVNGVDGPVDVATHSDDWVEHHEADVAAVKFTAAQPQRMNAFGLGWFVSADYSIDAGRIVGLSSPTAHRIPIEVGNEVVFVGLFMQSPGTHANLPIARFGHISRMPNEPVTVERPTAR
jgi:hypothetical protein